MDNKDFITALKVAYTGSPFQHLYNGTCPDAYTGLDSYDENCEACRHLQKVLTELGAIGVKP